MGLTTGNEIVDQIGQMHFEGNIIPHTWFHTIVKPTGKAYHLAINILADIVYWYRPTILRDENTMMIAGYKKKFSSDLLRRSYAELANFFTVTKGQATDAVVFLEKMGIIERVFRTVIVNGVTYNNVLHIKLNPEGLKRATFGVTDVADTYPEKSGEGVPKNPDSLSRKNGTPIPKNRETNTKNRQRVLQEISTKSEYREFVRMTEEEFRKLVDKYGQGPTEEMLDILDNYKGANGKEYKSDYRAILNWVVTRWKEQHGGKQHEKNRNAERLARESGLPF